MVSIVTSFALDKAIISGEAENGKRKRHRKEGEDERKRVRQKNRRDEPKDSPSRLIASVAATILTLGAFGFLPVSR